MSSHVLVCPISFWPRGILLNPCLRSLPPLLCLRVQCCPAFHKVCSRDTSSTSLYCLLHVLAVSSLPFVTYPPSFSIALLYVVSSRSRVSSLLMGSLCIASSMSSKPLILTLCNSSFSVVGSGRRGPGASRCVLVPRPRRGEGRGGGSSGRRAPEGRPLAARGG